MHAERLLDDNILLEELRKGSSEAVEALFERFHGKIYGLAMSILKNESDAEEAAQDVFLTVFQKFTEDLSEKYRVVFVLSDVEGLSNEETAQILGLTVPAVKSRLHRARLSLREQLSRELREGKTV